MDYPFNEFFLTMNHFLLPVSDWKHQRISHPVVKQALLCDRAGYITFRHSRSPSLATIVESRLEEQLDDTKDSFAVGPDRERRSMTRQNRGDEADDAGAARHVHVQRNDGIISLPSSLPLPESFLVEVVNATPEEPTMVDNKQKIQYQQPLMEIEAVPIETQEVDCSEFLPASSPLPLPLSSLTTTQSDSGGQSTPERTRSSLSALFSASKDFGRGNRINNDKSSPGELSGVTTKKRRRATVSSWFTTRGSTNASSSSPGMVPSKSSSGALGTQKPQEHQQASSSISLRVPLRTRQRVTVSNATAASNGTASSRWSERTRSASLKIQGLWSWLKEWPRRQKEVQPKGRRRSDDDCSSLTDESIQHTIALPPPFKVRSRTNKDDLSDSPPWEE
jgi:hypothetical protein